MVQVRSRSFVPENVLIMIGTERTTIFPLRVADPIAATDGYPAIFANRMPLLHERLSKPWDNNRCFGLKLSMRDIVIREGAVKRVLPRDEVYRDVVVPP